MIKNWKKLTTDEKRNEVPKIGELKNEGYSWDDISMMYNINKKTIKNYYHKYKIDLGHDLGHSSNNVDNDESVFGPITTNKKSEMFAILTSLFIQLILTIATFLCVIDFAIYKQGVSLGLMTLSVILIWINYILELQILKK